MLEWLLTCRSDDPDRARRGRLLNWFILIFLTITIMNVLTVLLSAFYSLALIILAMVAILLPVYWMNRAGHVSAASLFMVTMMLGVMHILAIMPTGDIGSASASALLLTIPVALAGVTLSWRYVTLFMVLAVLDSIWLYNYGIPQLASYRLTYPKDITIMESQSLIVLLGVGLISSLYSRQIQHLLFNLQSRNRDLEGVNQAMEAEKELLAITLDSSGEAIITTGKNGEIGLLNSVAEELSGWSQQEAKDLPLSTVFRIEESKTNEPYPDPLEGLDPQHPYLESPEDVILVGRDGSERYINYNISLILDKQKGRLGSVLVYRDVTEKRKIVEERLKANTLEGLGVLAGGIAHDFNNILTGIMGNISLAQLKVDESSDVQKFLDNAEKASLRAKDLVGQLLTFSRGGAPVKQTALLNETILETARFVLHGSKVEGAFDIPDDLWPVEADRGQISQVIQNLVINSIQAMPEGGRITLNARNVSLAAGEVPLLPAGSFVKISIKDEGTGIPPENLRKIFDPYFSTKTRSSGLGLSICYSIIHKHGGQILVDSQPGKGTTLTFYLPRSEQEVNGQAPKKTETGKFKTRNRRVLVMDDEEMIRDIISRILEKNGFQVETASEGSEAIAHYQKARDLGRPFNVVVMDLTIPGGMGGREAVKKLLEIDPKAKVIVASGYSNDPVLANFREYGFAGKLAKPFSISSFEQALEQIVA